MQSHLQSGVAVAVEAAIVVACIVVALVMRVALFELSCFDG